MSALRELRDKLENAAIQGCGSDFRQRREFVPNHTLKVITTYEAISRALQAVPSFEPYIIPAYTRHIESKARKIFAILLLIRAERLIGDFLQRDLIDAKLPLKFVQNDSVFLDAAGQRLFMEQQWRFLAPEFTVSSSLICRNFPEETILPFTMEESLGDGYSTGTSGKISKIWMHPSHQNYLSDERSSECTFARKKIESHGSYAGPRERKAFVAENRSLSMLLRLRHHSIVQLLAAFTHGPTYNFIFPLADMDLEAFLHQEQRSPAFDSDKSIYQAMAGAASALENIHDYEYKEQDMAMSETGFHHDLKPENILVRGRNFLITDFGLSRFSDKKSPAKFIWAGGAETYGPPEIDPEFRDRESESIDSCAVDLWSFGCIIIEVVAFILEGPQGLDEFRQSRLTWHGRSMDDCFHRGKALKPEVIAAIARYRELSTLGEAAVQSLDLARRLLDPKPSRRREVEFAVEAARVASNFRLCGFSERSDKGSNSPDLPLHKAAATGDANKVRVLIQEGVSITAKDEQSRTALHWAALCNQGAILSKLYETTNVNDRERLNTEKDRQGRTALSLAAQFANAVAVETIMKEATSQENLNRLVTQCDVFGMSPLHLACEVGDREIARLLLNAIGAEKERFEYKMLKDKKGMTALHYAAQNPECDMVLLLLFDGKEMPSVQSGMTIRMANNCDDDGLTPLVLAEESGCTYVAALLAEVTGANQKMAAFDFPRAED